LSNKPNSLLARRVPWIAGLVTYGLFVRPQLLKWGTKLGESQRRLPGDEIVPKPNFHMTHATNIDAPPSAVWPWLAQMGRERTGYYGLDFLTNQSIPSVTFVRQDVPAPEIGMEMDAGLKILQLDENRRLFLGGFNLKVFPGIALDLTVLYLLERRQDGSTRLLVRHRGFCYGFLGMIFNLIIEPIYFIGAMQQRNNLKRYAEDMRFLKSER
jgi:hypothetical protein